MIVVRHFKSSYVYVGKVYAQVMEMSFPAKEVVLRSLDLARQEMKWASARWDTLPETDDAMFVENGSRTVACDLGSRS